MYVVKNDYSFLNHIIVGHYWSSFSCGKCLKFAASNGQQMKRHIPDCGKPKKECKKMCSKGNKAPKAQNSSKSGHKSKKAKKNKADKGGRSMAGQKKPRGSLTKSSGTVATSQEQAPNTPCVAVRAILTPSPGHSKKSKKHVRSQRRSPNRIHAHMHSGVFDAP